MVITKNISLVIKIRKKVKNRENVIGQLYQPSGNHKHKNKKLIR